MIDEQTRSLSEYRLNKAKTLLTQAELLLIYSRWEQFGLFEIPK
jgi:hypothetical protein